MSIVALEKLDLGKPPEYNRAELLVNYRGASDDRIKKRSAHELLINAEFAVTSTDQHSGRMRI